MDYLDLFPTARLAEIIRLHEEKQRWINQPKKGFLRYREPLESIKHIRDGTSTSLMIGEMATVTHPRRRTFWAYSYTSYNASAAVPETRTLLGDFDRCVAVGGINGSNPCKRGWGSYHVDGFTFSMCDGSVRFINNHIDIYLFCDLASIDGGEPISW